MNNLLMLIWLILITLSVALLLNKRFGVCVPIVVIVSTFLVYIFGLLGNTKIGFYVALIIPLIIFPILKYKKITIHDAISLIKTPNFLVFVLFYLFVFAYQRFAHFNYWDEYMHWGPMVKEMFRLDMLYSVPESNLYIHKDYPPFVSLFELLWCYFNGSYSEAYCFRAISFFGMSFFLPIISNFNFSKENILKVVVCCVTILSLFTISINYFSFYFLNSIYTDAFISLFGAYTIYLAIQYHINQNAFNAFNLSISLAALLLTKQIAVAFFSMVLGLLFLFIIKEKKTFKSVFKEGIFFIVIPLMIFYTWSLFNSSFYLEQQFDVTSISKIDLLLNMLGINCEPWQIVTRNNFMNALIDKSILKTLNLNYIFSSILIAAVSFIVFLNHKVDKIREIKFETTSILFLGSIGYAVLMLFLYMSSFGPEEGTALASYERYMGTYIFFGLAVTTMFVIDVNSKPINVLVLVLFLVLSGFEGLNNFEFKDSYYSIMDEQKYVDLMNDLNQYIEEGSEIMYLNTYKLTQDAHMLNYELNHKYHFKEATIKEGLSLEEWQKELSNFDYLYIDFSDQNFYDNYWTPISEEYLLNNRLYKINEDGYCLIDHTYKCN